MSYTLLRLKDEARSRILAGASLLADALRPTLGPKSKCVLIEKKWGTPLVCNDGVTIAKEVRLKDPEEDLGVRMLREAAVKTGEAVGDGTTTATLLAHAIFSEGLRNVVAGASAIELKRGLELAHHAAAAGLKELSRSCATRREREQVATVSAHNDPTIGAQVAEAMERVGAEGVVTLEEAKGTETELDVVEGMRFDQGFSSPYFVTNPEKMEAVLEDAMVLVREQKITSIEPLLPVLELVVKSGRALLVIADNVEGEALATLVVNRIRGNFRCASVKAPGYGDRRKAMLEDIAIVTGGAFLAEELGQPLEKVTLEQLGTAKRVVIDKDTTTIIGGGGKKEPIQARCRELRLQAEKATSDYEREKLRERLAKLSSGVAVIRVGAPSEAEMKNRKEAFDDAINATKAAVAEGIVPGGGVALLRVLPALEALAGGLKGDEATGVRILQRALEIPARQIAQNSGFDPGVVVEHLRAGRGNMGFDAARGEYVDMLEAGLIDPTKVVRVALANAVSVASTLLLTEATLTEIAEPEESDGAAERFD